MSQTKRNGEELPMALTGDIDYEAVIDIIISSKIDDVCEERVIRHSLAISNKL